MTATAAIGKVHCITCGRTVEADVELSTNRVYRTARLVPVAGQKCPRCSASLDCAAVVSRHDGPDPFPIRSTWNREVGLES